MPSPVLLNACLDDGSERVRIDLMTRELGERFDLNPLKWSVFRFVRAAFERCIAFLLRTMIDEKKKKKKKK